MIVFQNKMEELYQIELGVLEETVIVKYLLREHQVSFLDL